MRVVNKWGWLAVWAGWVAAWWLAYSEAGWRLWTLIPFAADADDFYNYYHAVRLLALGAWKMAFYQSEVLHAPIGSLLKAGVVWLLGWDVGHTLWLLGLWLGLLWAWAAILEKQSLFLKIAGVGHLLLFAFWMDVLFRDISSLPALIVLAMMIRFLLRGRYRWALGLLALIGGLHAYTFVLAMTLMIGWLWLNSNLPFSHRLSYSIGAAGLALTWAGWYHFLEMQWYVAPQDLHRRMGLLDERLPYLGPWGLLANLWVLGSSGLIALWQWWRQKHLSLAVMSGLLWGALAFQSLLTGRTIQEFHFPVYALLLTPVLALREWTHSWLLRGWLVSLFLVSYSWIWVRQQHTTHFTMQEALQVDQYLHALDTSQTFRRWIFPVNTDGGPRRMNPPSVSRLMLLAWHWSAATQLHPHAVMHNGAFDDSAFYAVWAAALLATYPPAWDSSIAIHEFFYLPDLSLEAHYYYYKVFYLRALCRKIRLLCQLMPFYSQPASENTSCACSPNQHPLLCGYQCWSTDRIFHQLYGRKYEEKVEYWRRLGIRHPDHLLQTIGADGVIVRAAVLPYWQRASAPVQTIETFLAPNL